MFDKIAFSAAKEIEFLLLPKWKIVDHDSGQRSQDFEVSVFPRRNNIPITVERRLSKCLLSETPVIRTRIQPKSLNQLLYLRLQQI